MATDILKFKTTVKGPGPHTIDHNLDTKDIVVACLVGATTILFQMEIPTSNTITLTFGYMDLDLDNPTKNQWVNSAEPNEEVMVIVYG